MDVFGGTSDKKFTEWIEISGYRFAGIKIFGLMHRQAYDTNA
jgi:hypothetical protein